MADGRRDFILGFAAIGAAAAAPAPPNARRDATQVASNALDSVLRDWVQNLFVVWATDDTAQPERASQGLAQAIAAYHFGRGLIGLPTAPNEHIRSILITALNNAWSTYLIRLFNTWLHETGGRPHERNQKLMDNAMRAYLHAHNQLDELYPP